MSESFHNPADAEIKQLLQAAKRIAVVGMSAKPERASYSVARYLMAQGYEVIPVNPMETEIFGLKSYGSVGEIPGKIDIVDVFRRSDQTDPIIDEAIRVKARVVWLQLDVVNEAGCLRAQAAGLTAIQNRCIKIEHARLL
ncbi:MAG: CoA-binding protein [candidate division Zixibacteria bacterium]|nr:CoA-binding protein [candidate division Zixibacteria bacterium]